MKRSEINAIALAVVNLLDERQAEAARKLSISLEAYGAPQPKDHRAADLGAPDVPYYTRKSVGAIDIPGVSWSKRDQRYYVSFRSRGIGSSKDLGEAVSIRQHAEEEFDKMY